MNSNDKNPLRRGIFWILTLAVPALALIGLEIGLRIGNYDGDLGLVLRLPPGGKETYVINRNVARRYFSQPGITIPEPHEDRFTAPGTRGTKRVFCLGESTMEGFPYEFNATPPSFLKDRLRSLFPRDTVEVVNVGLSAVGSAVVEDFMQELIPYRPDLFVVYVGHNEFYGAYGPGSTIGGGAPPWLTRLGIRMLRFKTYLLLRDAVTWLSTRGDREGPAGSTLMAQVVGRGSIPYGSDTYRLGLRTYRENLGDMIDLAQAHGIPIMFSALVSNFKDQPPFVSVFSPGTDIPARKKWQGYSTAGENAIREHDLPLAIESFTRATSIDSINASGFYGLGRALFESGRYETAARAFIRAKDEDALRFRATEEFQQALLGVCRERGVPVSRVDSAFTAASPHGIIGQELILEHLHPNIAGYFLMAKTWADDIRKLGLLGPADPSSAAVSDSAMMERSAVTAFDEYLGNIKTAIMTARPPFAPRASVPPPAPGDSINAIVTAYVRHGIGWSDARYALGAYYARHGQYASARRECMAVSRVIPFSFQPLLKIAEYYTDEGKTTEAKGAFERCIAVQDNPFARMRLGFLLLREEKAQEAASEIEKGFAIDGKGAGALPTAGVATGRYLLGVAYAKSGRFTEAKESLKKALAIQPDFKDARDVLAQIP